MTMLEQLLEPSLLDRVGPVDRHAHLRHLGGVDGASPLNRLLAANFHSYLHDDLLVKADRMSMANSLEARAPFLDRALIEYVATLAGRRQAARPHHQGHAARGLRRPGAGRGASAVPSGASACRSTPGSAASCEATVTISCCRPPRSCGRTCRRTTSAPARRARRRRAPITAIVCGRW